MNWLIYGTGTTRRPFGGSWRRPSLAGRRRRSSLSGGRERIGLCEENPHRAPELRAEKAHFPLQRAQSTCTRWQGFHCRREKPAIGMTMEKQRSLRRPAEGEGSCVLSLLLSGVQPASVRWTPLRRLGEPALGLML